MELKFDHRRTMRGVRKCPHCGTYNGNRTSRCKNQVCQQKLNDIPDPVKWGSSSTVVVVQLLKTDYTNGHLYSIRDGHRDGLRNIIRWNVTADGKIGAFTCIQGPDISDKGNLTQIMSSCKSRAEAVPLAKETINSLAISEEEKLSLWEKCCHSGGPLVQRVSSDLFVVGHSQAVYGLFHVVALKKNQKYSHFHCDCQTNGQHKSSATASVCWHVHAVAAGLLSAPEDYGDRWNALVQKFVGQKPTTVLDSVHEENSVLSYEYLLAADDAAYISVPSEHNEMQSMLNSTYMELFNDEGNSAMVTDETTRNLLPTTCIPDIFAGGEESLHLMDCQIELMDELDPTDRIDFCPSFIECEDSLPVPENEDNSQTEKLVRITAKKGALKRSGRMAREKLTRGSYSVRKLMKVLESNGIIFNRLQHVSGATDGANVSPRPAYEATQCNLSFTCWLEFVIEQLNSVIDYNTDGKPAVQTFRIQEDFFRCLRARFSVGHCLRKPEPAHHTTDTESDRTQMYKFTHHKSLLHVFRTDKIELCFEKKFKRGPDDRYVPLVPAEDDNSEQLSGQEVRPIRPLYYSTYIKLGRYRHEPDPDRVYYFSLEWIAGVLPRSGFGDLRISFQYGHRMNNQYMKPPGILCTTE